MTLGNDTARVHLGFAEAVQSVWGQIEDAVGEFDPGANSSLIIAGWVRGLAVGWEVAGWLAAGWEGPGRWLRRTSGAEV